MVETSKLLRDALVGFAIGLLVVTGLALATRSTAPAASIDSR